MGKYYSPDGTKSSLTSNDLFQDIWGVILNAAKQIYCLDVMIEAKADKVKDIYHRFGFEDLQTNENDKDLQTMVLRLDDENLYKFDDLDDVSF